MSARATQAAEGARHVTAWARALADVVEVAVGRWPFVLGGLAVLLVVLAAAAVVRQGGPAPRPNSCAAVPTTTRPTAASTDPTAAVMGAVGGVASVRAVGAVGAVGAVASIDLEVLRGAVVGWPDVAAQVVEAGAVRLRLYGIEPYPSRASRPDSCCEEARLSGP